MNPPSITCVIPVRNGERYIAETLDSVFAQTYPASEVIVVDDGSTDGTRDTVARVGDRVRYIYRDLGNCAAARNLGIKASRGAFLSFLDADDLWHPDKLALQTDHLQTFPDIDMCVGHIQNFLAPEAVHESAGPLDHGSPIVAYVTDTLVVRRPSFHKVGFFDESMPHASTFDWFVRAREVGLRDTLLPEVLVRRRLHGSNISITGAAESRRAHLSVVRAVVKRRRARSRDLTEPGGDQCRG